LKLKHKIMKARYRLFRRGKVYWTQDNDSGKQCSLQTKSKPVALRLLRAKNEAFEQPQLNLQIARAYLVASDPSINSRTWQDCMNEILSTKDGPTLVRWKTAVKDRALDSIRDQVIVETRSVEKFRS
jgi:hypothetical protein